ncbi:tetratricopeptide repeat protein [Roseicyclus sp. F158]|uniref:Tetratricopeptide repeat protein n=1 Tax=Tropicimonas omnivorans TaxID=3075590 RepID=A0ABU3DLW6_9RHOB|nr:tetratricopeptide repeat protein [Roseicyclus sp. F158]MDT0684692.1 tetratricopeptide repeat protein [Roseicyclus sp. F158]
MATDWMRRVGVLAGIGALIALGVTLYNTNQGLRVRAALGQQDARLSLALAEYEDGRLSDAFETFEPLLLADYPPAILFMCDILNSSEGAEMDETCTDPGETPGIKRLEQLGELALLAREWQTFERSVQRRLEAGDVRAHFDYARYEALSQPTAPPVDAIAAHLTRSAEEGDPRGQYLMAIYRLRDIAEGAADGPIVQSFAGQLTKFPPLTDAEAYFELSKLMQSGLIDSELAYSEVLRRADEAGNPYAAGHMAQYLLANPEITEVGGQSAADWIAKAARNGDPVAQYNHAIALLEGGTSGAGDADEAERLLSASAAAGFAPSHTRLGALYWQEPERGGDTAEAGRRTALDHWQQAADKGDANALFNLGQVALAQGRTDEAVRYLERSAERGNAAAGDALTTLR